MRTVITYGTFDLFHIGHLRILERARAFGDRLVVGVSTDEFNAGKGKKTIIAFEDRAAIVAALKCVDIVFPEISWEQKSEDINLHQASVFAMGDDWKGKFDFLSDQVEVIYLSRTEGISSSSIKASLSHVRYNQI